jgi:hypothetical protein
VSTADGHVVGTTRILDNGPVEDHWNLVVMSEGYTSAEIGPMSTGQFSRDAQTIVDGGVPLMVEKQADAGSR